MQLCIHCEQPTDTADWRGLCPACHALVGIRVLYDKVKSNPPHWEQRLRYLRELANQGKPLFPERTPA